MYGYGYYPGFYFDPTYILILIGAILSMWASSRVKSTFARYDRVRNLRGITGARRRRRFSIRRGFIMSVCRESREV